jgi:hypothetical protein
VPVTDDEAKVNQLEAAVGHPGDKWEALKARVQVQAIKQFSTVEADWLDVLYTLDRYRSESVVPRGMGRLAASPEQRLAGLYRGKGNWYADLITLLLGNWTSQSLAPRSRVEGFSQLHQIDVAWPDRSVKPIQDPLICLETKVTGAPGYGSTSERKAMADWTNRRKELKFAATDLKLSRRASETTIDHWDVWRLSEKPKCYFLWGARMTASDDVHRMVREVQALTQTYLDGAAIFAWRLQADHYEPVSVSAGSPADRVSSVDDLLRRIATEIKNLAPTGTPPPPQIAVAKPVDPQALDQDAESNS